MSDLIDREALLKALAKDADVLKHARDLIRTHVVEAPAVIPKEAKWISVKDAMPPDERPVIAFSGYEESMVDVLLG